MSDIVNEIGHHAPYKRTVILGVSLLCAQSAINVALKMLNQITIVIIIVLDNAKNGTKGREAKCTEPL